jgi:hypothetical protein
MMGKEEVFTEILKGDLEFKNYNNDTINFTLTVVGGVNISTYDAVADSAFYFRTLSNEERLLLIEYLSKPNGEML